MADRRNLADGSKGRLEEAFRVFLEFVREKVRKANPANKNAPEEAGAALGQAFAQLVAEPSVDHIDALINFMKNVGIYEKGHDEKIKESTRVDPKFGLPVDLRQMSASGNNSDCLIHSFLTAVSREFRTLDRPSRDEFANVFRRGIFPVLPLVNCIIEHRKRGTLLGHRYFQHDFQELLLKDHGFLYEGHVFALAMQFRVNVVIFSHTRGFKLEPWSKRAISEIFTECLPRYDGRPFKPTVMIKEDGTHFEPIATPLGGYVVDIGEAEALVAVNEANRPRKICPACTIVNEPGAKICGMCQCDLTSVKAGPVAAPAGPVAAPAGPVAAPAGDIKVCPACTLVNKANAKRCELCNTDLTKVCPSCTFVNKANAKRCEICDTDLTVAFNKMGGGKTRRGKKRSKISRRKKM